MPRTTRAGGHHARSMSGANRRATEWISATVDWTDFTAGESQFLLTFSQAQLRDLIPFTITRTVGILAVSADFNFITNQSFLGAVGACTVREDARAAGQAPDAFANAGDDMWFWHQFFAMQIDDRTDSDIKLSETYVIDSRAQRKVADGDAIIFTGEGGSGADGFDVSLMIRMLVKLH